MNFAMYKDKLLYTLSIFLMTLSFPFLPKAVLDLISFFKRFYFLYLRERVCVVGEEGQREGESRLPSECGA